MGHDPAPLKHTRPNSALIRPRTLAEAQESPFSLAIKCFTHRHISGDVARQQHALGLVAKHCALGIAMEEIPILAQLLDIAGASTPHSHKVGAPLCAILRACGGVEFGTSGACADAKHGNQATVLLTALSNLLGSLDMQVHTAAAEALLAVVQRIRSSDARGEGRGGLRAPPSTSVLALDDTALLHALVAQLSDASTVPRRRHACRALLCLCRGNSTACERVLEAGSGGLVLSIVQEIGDSSMGWTCLCHQLSATALGDSGLAAARGKRGRCNRLRCGPLRRPLAASLGAAISVGYSQLGGLASALNPSAPPRIHSSLLPPSHGRTARHLRLGEQASAHEPRSQRTLR